MSWPVVEDGLRLDVHRVTLASKGYAGWCRWTWSRDGDPIGWINVMVTIHNEQAGTLALSYRCNGVPFDQRFHLEGEPCRFGGRRWFAICPVTHRRASKLYSLGGAGFHTRHRYRRVAYRTQRAPKAIDRVLMRRDRILFRKLKGDLPGYVPKPKWMRWKTYERWHAKLDEAEEQLDAHLTVLVGRLGRLDF